MQVMQCIHRAPENGQDRLSKITKTHKLTDYDKVRSKKIVQSQIKKML